jgi:hypothetical protein
MNIHEQNQGLYKDFPGQRLQLSSTFFWAFTNIKPCLTLPFFKRKWLYPVRKTVLTHPFRFFHTWGLEIAQIFIKHTANAATKVLTFPPWENRPSKVIWKVFLYLYFCHVWKDLKGGVKTVLDIKKKKEAKCHF